MVPPQTGQFQSEQRVVSACSAARSPLRLPHRMGPKSGSAKPSLMMPRMSATSGGTLMTEVYLPPLMVIKPRQATCTVHDLMIDTDTALGNNIGHAYPRLLAKPDRNLVLNPRQTIARGQFFGSGPELVKHIDAFVANYNQTVRPFVWMIPGSSEPR
jgi:hypothetical protein